MKNILKAIYTALVDNAGIGWIAAFFLLNWIAYSDPFNDRGLQGVLFGIIIGWNLRGIYHLSPLLKKELKDSPLLFTKDLASIPKEELVVKEFWKRNDLPDKWTGELENGMGVVALLYDDYFSVDVYDGDGVVPIFKEGPANNFNEYHVKQSMHLYGFTFPNHEGHIFDVEPPEPHKVITSMEKVSKERWEGTLGTGDKFVVSSKEGVIKTFIVEGDELLYELLKPETCFLIDESEVWGHFEAKGFTFKLHKS